MWISRPERQAQKELAEKTSMAFCPMWIDVKSDLD
jgi:hypothetical protein